MSTYDALPHEVNRVQPLDVVNEVPIGHHVNNRQPLPSANRLERSQNCDVNDPPPRRIVNRLSRQQRQILELAARPQGVSSHELVILFGGDRIRLIERYQGRWARHPRIVGTPASRSIAASVSRSLSGLYRAKLIDCRRHICPEGGRVPTGWRYYLIREAAP